MTSSIPAVEPRTAEGSALQAVLLDMDGTLVDTEGIWWDTEVSIFAELGHALAEEYREVVVGGPMTRSASFLIKATGADIALAELTGLLNSRFTELIDGTVPLLPGARRLLTELAAHGVPTALVSASHRRVMESVLRSIGPEHFALTVAGDDIGRTKPHPDPYLFAAAGLGADPARCVVVEDTVTGVTAAEAAGCQVVAVPSLVMIEPAVGRTVVGSLEEVDVPFLRTLITGMH
ncbi:putative hydrolase [Streptomyces bingchenggensis BCW-1]|uniref:Putative hydrolase n=1 Tax=Streptomyces bingchenggensis (strain BCW-1) TaxID=749414 RepID=D7BSU0_STRBB|nr:MULTISPECIES: HAD family phosphatase [Streptomyces]ADI11587.1 putative hydrolase [Streptomyces bingchenggensis BCW-1]